MDEPKSLDSLFREKIFRIPDYQRGYAWQREQLTDFWEDLVNLAEDRSHYTGVLTLKSIPKGQISKEEKEFWLVEDHSYQLYHIVDGQQRLTTFVILLQAFVDFIKALPEHADKTDNAIYITDSLSVEALQERYLFKVKPTGDYFRTYKFGYTEDNPSYEYLRYRILSEPGAGSIQETFYTLNLYNAKLYFHEQLRKLHSDDGIEGLQCVYKTLVKRFLFNEYIIRDEFDVFVAFETMNNRGKKLSDLELLKNRLIYLTTLYSDGEIDAASRANLRASINEAWKEIYHQLGRNKQHPLNDDDFLKAHWTMYFKYSRQKGNDYIRFLLDEEFSPKRVYKKIEREVELESIEEIHEDAEADYENGESATEEVVTISAADLTASSILDYVISLKSSVVYWFKSFYPAMVDGISDDERLWLERLNRIGVVYFRPLMMSILKNTQDENDRIAAFRHIERFIFLVFRLDTAKASYQSSVYYNAARDLDRRQLSIARLGDRLKESSSYLFEEDGRFTGEEFFNFLSKKFKSGPGFYGWNGLRYFLYEYELDLLEDSRQQKVSWDSLLKTGKDRISIEHIYPQTETNEWSSAFKGLSKSEKARCAGSLGNLLLLSASINSSLQNDSFLNKKKPKYDNSGNKLRNGYSDGSHSEIEVSTNEVWEINNIRTRGLRLLDFMEERWDIKFSCKEEKQRLLFLDWEK